MIKDSVHRNRAKSSINLLTGVLNPKYGFLHIFSYDKEGVHIFQPLLFNPISVLGGGRGGGHRFSYKNLPKH